MSSLYSGQLPAAGHLLATTVQTIPDPDKVSPGFAGFLVVFLIAIATIVLIRSMTRHLRAVRYSPDPADRDRSPADRPAPDSAAARLRD